MKRIFVSLVILSVGIICASQANELLNRKKKKKLKEEKIEYFSYLSLDYLNWDNNEFYFSQSPLKHFKGCDTLYSYQIKVHIRKMSPVSLAENRESYGIDWVLRDSILYLQNIHFIYLGFKEENEKNEEPLYRNRFRIMEDFTGRKFEADSLLKADWLNGIIDIKPTASSASINEYDDKWDFWKYGDYYRLYFTNGKMDSIKTIIPRKKD